MQHLPLCFRSYIPLLTASIEDFGSKLYPFMFGPDDKRDVKKEFLEKQIKGEDTFLPGKLSWPDFHLRQLCLDTTKFNLGDAFKDCPKIQR